MQTLTQETRDLPLSEALSGALGAALAAVEPDRNGCKTVHGRSKRTRRLYQATDGPSGDRLEVMRLPKEWQNPLRCQPRFVGAVPDDVEWKEGLAPWRPAKPEARW